MKIEINLDSSEKIFYLRLRKHQKQIFKNTFALFKISSFQCFIVLKLKNLAWNECNLSRFPSLSFFSATNLITDSNYFLIVESILIETVMQLSNVPFLFASCTATSVWPLKKSTFEYLIIDVSEVFAFVAITIWTYDIFTAQRYQPQFFF